MKNKKTPLNKKIKRITRIVNLAATVAVFAFAVYEHIPKYDKLDGVDVDKLIDGHSEKAAEN
ncbi:MAG: hypothetical protein ACI4GY_07445 [Acutalibacteraceae bacterium]